MRVPGARRAGAQGGLGRSSRGREQRGRDRRPHAGRRSGARDAVEPLPREPLRDQRAGAPAPVLYETNPTYPNLFGYLERRARFGALLTDFTRIRAGVLHKASGGVLVVRAADLLTDPIIWERMKRVLRERQIGAEDPLGPLGLYATSLRPVPVPIRVRVVLVGPPELYATLLQADADFAALFRVKVEVEPSIPTHEGAPARARCVSDADGSRARVGDVRPTRAGSTARLRGSAGDRAGAGGVEPLAPRGDDGVRERARSGPLHVRGERSGRGASLVFVPPWPRRPVEPRHGRGHRGRVARATGSSRRGRAARPRSHDPGRGGHGDRGTRVGRRQRALRLLRRRRRVRPADEDHSRRRARARRARRRGARGAARGRDPHEGGRDRPRVPRAASSARSGRCPCARRSRSSRATAKIDGDSASSSELFAVLSALADVGIDQGLAVTGSVNQLGEIQTIGGVCAKIEGFFDLCAARGLTGTQGVLMPRANLPHLVLREDVARAIGEGRFHLYAVSSVSQGIEIPHRAFRRGSGIRPGGFRRRACTAGWSAGSSRSPSVFVRRRRRTRITRFTKGATTTRRPIWATPGTSGSRDERRPPRAPASGARRDGGVRAGLTCRGSSSRLDANEAPARFVERNPRRRRAGAGSRAAGAIPRRTSQRAEGRHLRADGREEPDDLLIGTGSDEVISLILNALARPASEACRRRWCSRPTPTFVMYRVTARGHGMKSLEVPLDSSWDLDVSAMTRAISAVSPSVVFIASPNNPTGNRMSEDRLAEVIEAARRRAGGARRGVHRLRRRLAARLARSVSAPRHPSDA